MQVHEREQSEGLRDRAHGVLGRGVMFDPSDPPAM
jgi:hypothetical protein